MQRRGAVRNVHVRVRTPGVLGWSGGRDGSTCRSPSTSWRRVPQPGVAQVQRVEHARRWRVRRVVTGRSPATSTACVPGATATARSRSTGRRRCAPGELVVHDRRHDAEQRWVVRRAAGHRRPRRRGRPAPGRRSSRGCEPAPRCAPRSATATPCRIPDRGGAARWTALADLGTRAAAAAGRDPARAGRTRDHRHAAGAVVGGRRDARVARDAHRDARVQPGGHDRGRARASCFGAAVSARSLGLG